MYPIKKITYTSILKSAPFLALVLLPFSGIAQGGTELFFSEYLEGTGNNQALEIFNPGTNQVDLAEYRVVRSNDGGGWEIWKVFPAGVFLPSKSVWTIVNSQFTAAPYDINLADEKTLSSFISFRGNDAIGLMKVTVSDTVLIDVIGIPDNNPGSGWDVAGIYNATANHTMIRKAGIITGSSDWDFSRGSNSANSQWIIRDYDFADSLGHHYYKPIILVSFVKLNVAVSPEINTDHGSLQLSPEILPSTATDPSLQWSSSDPNVASVNQNGLVQSFNNGATWIRAATIDGSGLADSITITVINQSGILPVNFIQVHGFNGQDTIRQNKGSLLMIADIVPENASNKKVLWTVDNPQLADITPDGLLTVKKNGVVTVTATSTDGSGVIGTKRIIIIEQYTEFNTLSDLRASYTVDKTLYKITSEVVLSQSIHYRNIKFVQDSGAGIQIDDGPGIITSSYNTGDGITGLTGYLQESYGMLLFLPVSDPGMSSSQNNNLTPIVLTLKEFIENFEIYESRLVKINQLIFENPGGLFEAFSNYPVKAGNDISILRTEFANADFLGTVIPYSANITGIAIQLNTTPKIAPRKLDDIEKLALTSGEITSGNFKGVSLYPNPADNELHVLSGRDIKYFEIRDISGRIIQSLKPLKNIRTVDTVNLNSGMYIITFYLDYDRVDCRFIKR